LLHSLIKSKYKKNIFVNLFQVLFPVGNKDLYESHYEMLKHKPKFKENKKWIDDLYEELALSFDVSVPMEDLEILAFMLSKPKHVEKLNKMARKEPARLQDIFDLLMVEFFQENPYGASNSGMWDLSHSLSESYIKTVVRKNN
jgi:hypothetical protein